MLPFLTIIFILGLALGSYLLFFPFSIAVLLGAVTVATVLAERRGLLRAGQGHLLLGCLFGGCLYWTLFARRDRGLPARLRDPARLGGRRDGRAFSGGSAPERAKLHSLHHQRDRGAGYGRFRWPRPRSGRSFMKREA